MITLSDMTWGFTLLWNLEIVLLSLRDCEQELFGGFSK